MIQIHTKTIHQSCGIYNFFPIRTTLRTLHRGTPRQSSYGSQYYIHKGSVSARLPPRAVEFLHIVHATIHHQTSNNEIFEADFNSGPKYILGCKLLYHGEEHGINSTQIYGSRPGRATHDTLAITKLAYDITRLDKVKQGVTTECALI